VAEISAPFRGYRTTVQAAWIDYNGHLNDAYYSLIFSEANELFLDALDLSSSYREASGRSLYTAELHLRYLREAVLGQQMQVETVLIDADSKRLHVHDRLLAGENEIATAECLYLNVDQHTGRVVAFDEVRLATVAATRASHSTLDRPDHLGRGVWARRNTVG
jgi:acyl-CoA thioesterase FadM